jgi:hypothetical protein
MNTCKKNGRGWVPTMSVGESAHYPTMIGVPSELLSARRALSSPDDFVGNPAGAFAG